jgi:threonine dehydrogenase-like Zn-dependent dehydrogenase
VALRAVHHAAVTPGSTVVVSGLGMIGLGCVAFAALAGPAHVIGVDPSPLRRAAAERFGAGVTVDPRDDVVAAVREVTGPGGYGLGAAADVSIECSGVPAAFSTAIKVTRHGGAVVLVAQSHEPFAVRSGRIIEKELRVQGSFAYRGEMGEVVALLAEGRVDAAAFVTHRFPLEDVAEAFRVQADAASSLKVLVQP